MTWRAISARPYCWVPKSEFTAATLRDSLEGEVRRSHGRYGDFSFSRWVRYPSSSTKLQLINVNLTSYQCEPSVLSN